MAVKKLWRLSKSKLLVKRGSKIMNCQQCPCECEPYIIAEWTTNASNPQPQGTVKCIDFTPYRGDGVGIPGAKWRSIETGACLLRGGSGDVDEKGKLVGLPQKYCTSYSYNGYVKLQIGCPQPDGSIKWATRCR